MNVLALSFIFGWRNRFLLNAVHRCKIRLIFRLKSETLRLSQDLPVPRFSGVMKVSLYDSISPVTYRNEGDWNLFYFLNFSRSLSKADLSRFLLSIATPEFFAQFTIME